jgi:HAD superfamily phosphatase (TIGR01668 family)
MLNLRMYTPTVVVARIADITPVELRARGITAIITDLDNTLVPWRRHNIEESVHKWLAELNDAGVKIVIASNTLSTGRLKKLSETMNIPYVERVRKPWVDGFVRAMELMESSRETTAVVGDQLFTDVLCGNLLGLTTILLRPPLSKEEFISTRLLRNIERLFIGRMKRRGSWPDYLSSVPDSQNTTENK